MTAQKYLEYSRILLSQARTELAAGDVRQASEKGWGAAAQIVQAIAARRDWEHQGHRELFRAVDRLFDVASALHINFYEDWRTSGGFSEALGAGTIVRIGRPNSSVAGENPIRSNTTEAREDNRPMYGLSEVFEVVQLPSNTGTLTTGGTPRTGSITGSDTGEYWQVKLHQNVRYRIDVKGSESSQYGGTITNPRILVIAGSPNIELLNDGATGVSQTRAETVATAGGAGHNSRLDLKVIGDTKYYFLLIHRGAGSTGRRDALRPKSP